METVKRAKYRLIYAGSDITADITPFLVQLSYTDYLSGKTDELTFSVEDSDKLWRTSWRPQKKDVIEAFIGYDNNLVNCGTFEVDQIDFSGPPDQVTIRAIAARISQAVRTELSFVHEQKTLAQIAQAIADKHGLTLQGDIEHILFERTTQLRESDFGFLNRIAGDYGYIFNVRDTTMTFVKVFEMDASDPVKEIDRIDLIRYSINDKSTKTYQSAEIKYQNPTTNRLIGVVAIGELANAAQDVLQIRGQRCENDGQALTRAEAAIHVVNTMSMDGSITVEGDPVSLAGNSFDFTGMGYISGKYKILESTHTISQGAGYVTVSKIKRVGEIDSTRWLPRNQRQTTSNLIVND